MTSSISGASSTVCGIELELAGLDLGEVEHLVDETEQVGAGAMHALQRLLRLFRAEARRVGDHHLGEPDDGIERRAQLVAHAGEELRLVLARQFELAALLLHFREQIRVLDRQHRLCGEGLQQIDRARWEIRPAALRRTTSAPTIRSERAAGPTSRARKPARTMTSSTGDDGSFWTSGIWIGLRRAAASPIAVSPMCM